MLAAFYTLGCKLNQLESESIADAFRREGFSVVPWNGTLPDSAEQPDHEIKTGNYSLFILNTCTVTSKSEQKARRIIRKILREHAETVVIVTGCYAQVEAEALKSLDSWLFVVPGKQKHRILDLPKYISSNPGVDLRNLVSAWADGAADGEKTADVSGMENENKTGCFGCTTSTGVNEESFCFVPGSFSFHSRAFLKIQDGCDNSCAYCRVSIARGRSRSLDAAKALETLKILEDNGYREAVLTGVNISQYHNQMDGRDLDLAGLLETLICKTNSIRIRLSSVEPEILTTGFFNAVSHERIRPHFHVCIQSGSESILRRMKRNYLPGDVLEGIRRLRTVKNDPFLGCDIITGFPGETDEDFQKTLDFCKNAGFSGIHAFPFSRRPGTDAWNYKNRVTEKEAGLRAGKLIELAAEQRKNYVLRWLGQNIEAIAEEGDALEGFFTALSANYLKLGVFYGKNRPKPGEIVQCRLLNAAASGDMPDEFDAKAEIILK